MDKELLYILIIYASVLLALLWAAYNFYVITQIEIKSNPNNFDEDNEMNLNPTKKKLNTTHDKLVQLTLIADQISKGADSFLYQEYKIMSFFILIFGVIIFVVVDILGQKNKKFRCYTTVAFVLGSVISMVCGYIGMRVAVMTNYRTTYKCMESLEKGFIVAYRGGIVMGFITVGLGLGSFLTIMLVYIEIFDPVTLVDSTQSYGVLIEQLAGFGLGGSCMALFGRVGGGIFTKAADVGADLVGKIEAGLEEDSPRNPATIADNVGDNVGDIAGMGSDLFGSFATSTAASLVVIASTQDLIDHTDSLYYPFLISAGGLFSCLITSFVGIYVYKVNHIKKIPKALNLQLLMSTVLSLGFIVGFSFILPDEWQQNSSQGVETVYYYYAMICSGMGLVAGFFIGMSTDYYTSHSYRPVREMAESCSSGAAINIIYGLSLGYLSTVIPIILISITILVSLNLLDMLGVSLAAIGMLSTLAVELAIDTFGPICDNAGGLCAMAEIGEEVRILTDALDAAGNTTAAVGKGFAIGSASLVSLALFGAYIRRVQLLDDNAVKDLQITNPWILSLFFIGAMLPYAFSALTMKSVGEAAQEMVKEVRRQFQDPRIKSGEIEPDYQRCIAVSTKASLKEMVLPGCIVIFSPLFFGILFHPILIIGLLPGALLSGIQLAISMSNSGGAWDNCKKYIESGMYITPDGVVRGKGTPEHEASVIGDTVGDPLKDTSGPSLNILIKLMAIISLVFAGGFGETAFLSGVLNIEK